MLILFFFTPVAKQQLTATGLKPKYRDPRTKTPYATLAEYKEIQALVVVQKLHFASTYLGFFPLCSKKAAASSLSEASKRLSRASTMKKNAMKALKEILFVPNKACW